MYIGLALERAGGKLELDPGWLSSSRNLADMIKEIRKGNTEGYVLFDYSSLYRDGHTLRTESLNFFPVFNVFFVLLRRKDVISAK